MSLLDDKRYLGFDYGEKRIGVACGNSVTQSATSLKVIANNSGTPDWQTIDLLVAEWNPAALLVGDPLSLDGEVVEITRQARGFAKRLGKRYTLPVHLIDERFSSIAASEVIREQRSQSARRQTRKGDLDRVSAALLTEKWLHENH